MRVISFWKWTSVTSTVVAFVVNLHWIAMWRMKDRSGGLLELGNHKSYFLFANQGSGNDFNALIVLRSLMTRGCPAVAGCCLGCVVEKIIVQESHQWFRSA